MVVFLFLMPIVVEKFTKAWILTPFLTFLIAVGYWGLNAVAQDLENPFGHGANDLPVKELCETFVDRVVESNLIWFQEIREQRSVHKYSCFFRGDLPVEPPKMLVGSLHGVQVPSLSRRMSSKKTSSTHHATSLQVQPSESLVDDNQDAKIPGPAKTNQMVGGSAFEGEMQTRERDKDKVHNLWNNAQISNNTSLHCGDEYFNSTRDIHNGKVVHDQQQDSLGNIPIAFRPVHACANDDIDMAVLRTTSAPVLTRQELQIPPCIIKTAPAVIHSQANLAQGRMRSPGWANREVPSPLSPLSPQGPRRRASCPS